MRRCSNIPVPHGETRRPATVEELFAKRPRLGDGNIPAELELRRTRTDILIETTGAQPRIEVVKNELQRAGTTTWRVSVAEPSTARITRAQYVHTLRRAQVGSLDAGKIDNATLTSFRPSWADLSFTPRVAPQPPRATLRRLNGHPVQPANLFWPDDRRIFHDASWPYGLVGRLENNIGRTCTAALVGPRVIVTASHCIPWEDPNAWIRFIPAYWVGSSLHGTGVESYVSDVIGWTTGADEVCGYDYAVCRLFEPLGEWLGYFGFNGYSSDWNGQPWWVNVGYPLSPGSAELPSIQYPFSCFDVDGDAHGSLELETKADISEGNSGGPMFGWFPNDDPRIVGVVSGDEEDWQFPLGYESASVFAGGNDFVELISWARANWP